MKPIKQLISELSEEEREVLGQIAMNMDSGHDPVIVEKLVNLLLVESDEDSFLRNTFGVAVRRYYTPLHVHLAWCAWCAKNIPLPEEELNG